VPVAAGRAVRRAPRADAPGERSTRPTGELLDEAKAWAAETAEKSPTAIRFTEQSYNADTDHQAGLSNLAMSALALFTASPEGLARAACAESARWTSRGT
jgi:1,4-dihydroxy-2-naphthoyl-CoA synthase